MAVCFALMIEFHSFFFVSSFNKETQKKITITNRIRFIMLFRKKINNKYNKEQQQKQHAILQ